MIGSKPSFFKWVEGSNNYTKLQKSLYTKPGFEKYRHIKHGELLTHIETMEFDYPRQVFIPKDPFSEREVFLYGTLDNIVLKLYNMYLNEVYSQDISQHVYSYREGVSVAKILRDFYNKYNPNKVYVKVDLSNYFMTPEGVHLTGFISKYGLIDEPFSKLFENKFYVHKSNNIGHKNLGLLPGAPISAFLSNAYMKPFDDYMSNKYPVFFRYSDDFVTECGDYGPEYVIEDIKMQLNKLGLEVNQRKTEIFKQGEPPLFLGSEFYEDGYQLSRKRISAIKKIIKSKSKRAVKSSLGPDDRVRRFLKYTYAYLFQGIIKNIYRGGVVSSWFSCTSMISQLQEIDYYILDKCRFVYSKKTNFGALKKGINTDYLENLGFISLVCMWKIYRKNPLIMSFTAFAHLKKFKQASQRDYTLAKPRYLSGVFDFLDLLLLGEKSPIDTSLYNIDYANNKILLGDTLIFDEFVSEHVFTCNQNSTVSITIKDSYDDIDQDIFLDLFRRTSYKYLKFKTYRTKIFNPLPYNYLPYYSYMDVSKSETEQLVACLLFLYNTGRIKIGFKDVSSEYIIIEDDITKFININNHKQIR